MYDLDILGEYAEDYLLVERTLNKSIEEISSLLIEKLNIVDEDGKPTYDADVMNYITRNVHIVRTKADVMKAIFFDEFKKLAEEEDKDGQERVNEEGE